MAGRVLAAEVLTRVLAGGESLTAALAVLPQTLVGPDQAWIKAACYGVMRDYPKLKFYLDHLMNKPVKAPEIESLLLLGLYQLTGMQVKTHAAVSETVAAVSGKQRWAKGLVNGVLRNFLRQRVVLEQAAQNDPIARWAHPKWLIDRFFRDWPEQAEDLLTANNRQAPMTLRVNLRQVSRQQYLEQLQALGLNAQAIADLPAALTLDQAAPVDSLPGFEHGWVSVQDGAAQWAAALMTLAPGQRVLDACAAPGGKTGHMLELCPDIDLLALDIVEQRLTRIQDNLTRLRHDASLQCADAARPDSWWDGCLFDRILLDAPCSGTGVIRRHPDIKLHRRPGDISALADDQQSLLEALWPLLSRGGMMLYATCSMLKDENERQIEAFMARHPDARIVSQPTELAFARPFGQQFFTGHYGLDGFFYARLAKV